VVCLLWLGIQDSRGGIVGGGCVARRVEGKQQALLPLTSGNVGLDAVNMHVWIYGSPQLVCLTTTDHLCINILACLHAHECVHIQIYSYACAGDNKYTHVKLEQTCQKEDDAGLFHRNPLSLFMGRFGHLFEDFTENGW
jgi:hypothetical protein